MGGDFQDFKHLFPPETKIINFKGSADNYVANLRCKCKNKEEFTQNWLKQYENISGVALRVQLTRPRCGITVVYKAAYRCERNTYPNSHQRVKTSYKHTDCQAVMRVTIKSSIENRRVRSKDALRGEYPTLITIEHNHNHSIKPASADEIIKYTSREEKTNNDSPVVVMQLQNDDMREVSLHHYEEFVDSSVYPNIYILPNTDVQQEIEITTHHAEVTTEQECQVLSWSSLKDRWKLLFEKWQKENSINQYNAVSRALTLLQDCKTETAAISALECLGKCFKAQKSGAAATRRRRMQTDSTAKFSFSDHNYNKQKDPQNEQLPYSLQDCDDQELFLKQ